MKLIHIDGLNMEINILFLLLLLWMIVPIIVKFEFLHVFPVLLDKIVHQKRMEYKENLK